MAAMDTATRIRSISDVRALHHGNRDEGIEREALIVAAEILGIFEQQRELEEMSNAALAREMGVERSQVSRLLKGEGANPTLLTIVRLLDALGLHAELTIRQARDGDDGVVDVWDELPESALIAQRASGVDAARPK